MSDPVSDPVAAFRAAAAGNDRMFWLDGGGAQPWSGTRSVIGVLGEDDVSLSFDATEGTVRRHGSGADEVVGDDIFACLADEVARDDGDPAVHWVGYFGYACRRDLPGRPATPGSGVPDAVWMRVRDPQIGHGTPPPPAAAPAGSPQVVREHGRAPDPGYAAAYDEVQRQLRAGNSYEVNLTYREQVDVAIDPAAAYLRLRALNPAPYSGFLQHRGVHLLSSSPERFATIDRHGWIETKPIKGTTPRSEDPAEDEAQRALLASHPKYRAENLMIVDLLRSDLARVCVPGSVSVPSLMAVESYPSVHQLVSTVRGRLRPDLAGGRGTVEALRSLFPAGSMTGAPKRRTMEIIDAVESTPRGVYAGAFGWLNADGRADLSVVIRTLVATDGPAGSGSHRYELGTGGGVTVASTVAEEYAETRWKAQRLSAALEPH